MRYQSWDCLLFPGDSTVPIQEFGTKCFVISAESGLASTPLDPGSDPGNFESITHVPIVTSFVIGQEFESPYRVSIHNWDQPKPSHLLVRRKLPEEVVAFEVQLLSDGVLQTQRLFLQDAKLPKVIGQRVFHENPGAATEIADYGADDIGIRARPRSISHSDWRGEPDTRLKFPQFHEDVLHQPHWEPGDDWGRIKIVIWEGVLRQHALQEGTDASFDRFRQVVAFSFQHAPKDILESSGIAWPNAKMFGKVKRSTGLGPIRSRMPTLPGREAHLHSPSPRPSLAFRDSALNGVASGKMELQGDESQGLVKLQRTLNPMETVIACANKRTPSANNSLRVRLTEDPFVCAPPARIQQWRLQVSSSSHDTSMPDYVSVKGGHSRECTEMSGIDYSRTSFAEQMNEANPREILQALSPERLEELRKALSTTNSPVEGVFPPANTPLSISDTDGKPGGDSEPSKPRSVAHADQTKGRGVWDLCNTDDSDSFDQDARRQKCHQGCGEEATPLSRYKQAGVSSASSRGPDDKEYLPTISSVPPGGSKRTAFPSSGSKRRRSSSPALTTIESKAGPIHGVDRCAEGTETIQAQLDQKSCGGKSTSS